MSQNSKIDYVDSSINPTGWGCFGPGGTAEKPNRCPYCYGWRMAKRNLRECPQCRDFVPHWHAEELNKLARWERGRRVLVESMGDLFGAGVHSWQREAIFRAVVFNKQHTCLFLTKEAEGMQKVMSYWNGPPVRNLWLGVSVTNQTDAGERIRHLVRTPAAVRFLSVEPLLGAIDHLAGGISWVIIGAQTGPSAVKPERRWVEVIADQCKADVPIFMKANLQAVWETPLIQQYPEARE